mmetsp:Transcript_74675/g.207603  ORF Transcript_74675/g.207603 Transcript_74675/m.207603 type:complete len:197 (-) Transcript_74675:50-640(-)
MFTCFGLRSHPGCRENPIEEFIDGRLAKAPAAGAEPSGSGGPAIDVVAGPCVACGSAPPVGASPEEALVLPAWDEQDDLCRRSSDRDRVWLAVRSAWLGLAEEDLAVMPESFDDMSHLELMRLHQSKPADLSDDEMQDVEECLAAVQQPFPPLRRNVPLSQAVACAVVLWRDGGMENSVTSTFSKILRRGLSRLTR